MRFTFRASTIPDRIGADAAKSSTAIWLNGFRGEFAFRLAAVRVNPGGAQGALDAAAGDDRAAGARVGHRLFYDHRLDGAAVGSGLHAGQFIEAPNTLGMMAWLDACACRAAPISLLKKFCAFRMKSAGSSRFWKCFLAEGFASAGRCRRDAARRCQRRRVHFPWCRERCASSRNFRRPRYGSVTVASGAARGDRASRPCHPSRSTGRTGA